MRAPRITVDSAGQIVEIEQPLGMEVTLYPLVKCGTQ